MSLIERIADLLEVELSQLVIIVVAIAVVGVIWLAVWLLYWTWMFQFFGG